MSSAAEHTEAAVSSSTPVFDPGTDRGASRTAPRLEEIRGNLHARIAEAEREGWLGDVEQLAVSLATDAKISQIDARERRKDSPVFIGMPPIGQLVGREAENRDKTG
ncbi:hypothetical protein [Nonomuraea dietziae]|uniref:Uncharacterized protein n=1 Tax=Nonomuraea dietziae TaxID=65515 RepID=A0A7W5V670_9ACTN|nr:hypothetical protein [Nonomuraea dietziae]MBB3725640.1 hypothetical protein [Nonomuraea dietziae]